MTKLKLGIIVGASLGLIDGLSTFFVPEAVESGMMPMVIVGSTVKGVVSGWLIGVFAQRYRSMPKGLAFGLLVGLFLSFLVALMPDPNGEHHYVEIMLPGALLGVIVGYVSQRWGHAAADTPAAGTG